MERMARKQMQVKMDYSQERLAMDPDQYRALRYPMHPAARLSLLRQLLEASAPICEVSLLLHGQVQVKM